MQDSLSINSDHKLSLLDSLELFKGVRPDDVQELLQSCTRRDLSEGDLLLSPDGNNEYVFIVLSGRLNVHVGAADAPEIGRAHV